MGFVETVNQKNWTQAKAFISQNQSIVNQMDEHGTPYSHIAAACGNVDFLRFMVEYSFVSLNTVDSDGRSLLHYAALSGDVESCRYLTKRCGMSPLLPDSQLLTPYDLAVANSELNAYFEQIVGAPISAMYRNPIRRGMFPDPSVVRVGQDYYMVHSSFVFFPCLPVAHSRDLVHWQVIGHAVSNPEWAGLEGLAGGRGYWAPDISYYDGLFYICATYRLNDDSPVRRRQMIVTAEKPEGPYSKPVFIDEDGIDPSLFHDDDGRHYLLLNRGARIMEIDLATFKPLTPATMLYYGDMKRAPEGPHLLKKDGWYYLFLAEGGTGIGHRETVARSKTLHGVYEPCPYNPIVRQWDENAPIQRCGHGKPFCTQHGDWYMVYLCGRAFHGKYTLMGRETALDPLTWTADGWPLLNGGRGPSALQLPPRGLSPVPVKETTDWVTPRPPKPSTFQWQPDGELTVNGDFYDLHDVRCRSLLLCRQTEFTFSFQSRVKVLELPEGGECGLCWYYDENSFFTLGLCQTDGAICLRVREQIGLNTVLHDPLFLSKEDCASLWLKGDAEGLCRRLYYATEQQPEALLLTLSDTAYLSDEGLAMGKRFTGAMVGVYATMGARAVFSNLTPPL
ncbi:MAG: family 43 glycosylhydrolase [Eubacteriales bacterium]|nr:family 43 glycosylhydrolase [Eubacteriales bacterium]